MSISDKFISYLSTVEIIKSEDEEIYKFGITQLFSIIVDLIIAISIGFIMNSLLQMIIFIFTFSTIRRYAGGYHANKKILCILFSATMEILAMFIILNYEIIFIYIAILSILGILILSPISNENIVLEDIENKVYRLKAIKSTLFWSIILFFCIFLKLTILYKSISIAIIFCFILLIIEWIRYKNKKLC